MYGAGSVAMRSAQTAGHIILLRPYFSLAGIHKIAEYRATRKSLGHAQT
jgi:hypothetical protein